MDDGGGYYRWEAPESAVLTAALAGDAGAMAALIRRRDGRPPVHDFRPWSVVWAEVLSGVLPLARDTGEGGQGGQAGGR